MDQLLEQFLLEARENLKFIEQNLENLEPNNRDLLESIFRETHTLKGGAGIVGFVPIKTITHTAEDLLEHLRSGKIEFQEEIIEALYDAFDEVVNLTEAAQESQGLVEGDPKTIESVTQKLSRFLQQKEATPWSLPFQLLEKSMVIHRDLAWLKSYKNPIPFFQEEITQENLHHNRLYAISIDPEQECIAHGNDPLTSFAALDTLVALECCTTLEEAKTILMGEDEQGLDLKTAMLGYAYTSWESIAKAFNAFLDDLSLLPLDIATLLEAVQAFDSMEFFKDLRASVQEGVKAKDKEKIRNALTNGLSLVSSNSQEFFALTRVLLILDHIQEDELSHLLPLFGAEEQEKPQESLETNSNSKEVIDLILTQQQEQLEGDVSRETLQRVVEIINRCAEVAGFEKVEESLTQCREFLKTYLQQEALPLELPTPQEDIEERIFETQNKKPSKSVIGKVVKIEQEAVDHLMGVVGEILVAKNSLPYLAHSVTSENPEATKRSILEKYSSINRLTEKLQDIVMSMRMLPMSYIFDRYPKLVREMSKDLGKRVKLFQEGEETKLDKNLIEMLAEPLMHIVRNSLDHGIETPKVRRDCQKEEVGTIIMKAYSQSDKVYIEIADDGKGIDTDTVIKKVLEKDLLDTTALTAMSEDEKVELIMLPGLSTAQEISQYSGRGVGMDVVKKSIESFGGEVRLSSVLGSGTTVILAVPVSLAVSTLLHVMMGDNHYGFPIDSVQESIKLEKKNIVTLHNKDFITLRDKIIPVIFQEGMIDRELLEKEELLSMVILHIKGNLVAVVVNKLLEQLDVVQKPLDGMLAHHPLLSGTALLGNGQILMVIDPISLLEIGDIPKEIPSKEELYGD